MSRPRLVTAPISARLVVSSVERMASCLLRRAGGLMRRAARRGRREGRRARCGPVALRNTRHGTSATSSTAAARFAAAPAMLGRASVSSVRRGVPKRSATSASSSETSASMRCRLASSSSSSSISARSLSRSASSSMRENLVSRRRRSSRMYSACTWLRSKTSMRRVRACSRLVARADDLDDLVDVEDRDEQALDEVQALPAAGEAVLRAAGDDLDAVRDVHLQQLAQAERLRPAVDERDVVDVERVLERASAGRAARARRRG